MIDIQPVFKKTTDYLQDKVKDFKIQRRGKVTMILCPLCKTQPNLSCNILPGTSHKMKCFSTLCKNRGIFTVFDVIREIESDKKELSDEEIAQYLAGKYDIKLEEVRNQNVLLAFFESQVFDLVPIAKDQKAPIEKNWPKKQHKQREEWEQWLRTGLNIGVKTGKISAITVIDVDIKPIPEEIDSLKGECLIQETPRGFHLFYQYVSELPKTRIDELHTDIENDGGQVVLEPSIAEGKHRRFLNLIDVGKMPPKLIELLKSKTSIRKVKDEKEESDIKQTLSEPFNINKLQEGNRNTTLIHLGGILRKHLNLSQTSFVLDLMNKGFVQPPVTDHEFRNLIKKLDDYIEFDETELAEKVLGYLRLVEEAYANEISSTIGEPRQKVDKALKFLLKEGKILKARRMFQIIKRADWKDTFIKLDNEINFVLPYFQDLGHWQWGDMILLGSKSKYGKTTISMNMVEQFVKQGIKPYYICLETGSRFIKTALQLGLKEGDFFYDFQANPTHIELEQNAVTILDWLMISDKSQTDSVMKHFIQQLYKTNGFLIIFMQLKQDGGWFAPNMVEQFPALASRYLYTDDNEGIYGAWECDVIREPRVHMKKATVPCKYEPDTKRLIMVDESEQPEKK